METVVKLPLKKIMFSTFHKYKDELMNKTNLPSQIDITDDNDYSIILSALLNHPNVTNKIGCGVQSLFVKRSTALYHGDIIPRDICCCYVKRTDGTEEDFSIYLCYGVRSWKSSTDGLYYDSKTNSFIS